MNAESIPVVVADSASGESSKPCEAAKPASASTPEPAPSVASKEQPVASKEQPVAPNEPPVPSSARKGADDAVPLSDSAIVVIENTPAAPKTWRSAVSLVKPKPVSSEAVSVAPDARVRESMSPVWMNARKGAKPAGAVVGASTILFFVVLVLAVAGSSALALVYVGPEGQSRTRATVAPSRIETASAITSKVPVAMPAGPTLPLVVTAPEAPPATPAPPTNAKRSTPPTPTTTRARLSITTSPY